MRRLLYVYLGLMGLLLVFALARPDLFLALVEKPELYVHAKFIHVLSVTLLFANAVIGTIWETRSLLTKRPEIIRYTYRTVVWLDAVFTAPLVILAVISGIMLGTILGGVWTMGWLSIAFSLFLVCGAFWVAADIPTQYKINRLFATVAPGAPSLPSALTRLLWCRLGINLASIGPLLFIFYLMVHKPDLPKVGDWFKRAPDAVARLKGFP